MTLLIIGKALAPRAFCFSTMAPDGLCAMKLFLWFYWRGMSCLQVGLPDKYMATSDDGCFLLKVPHQNKHNRDTSASPSQRLAKNNIRACKMSLKPHLLQIKWFAAVPQPHNHACLITKCAFAHAHAVCWAKRTSCWGEEASITHAGCEIRVGPWWLVQMEWGHRLWKPNAIWLEVNCKAIFFLPQRTKREKKTLTFFFFPCGWNWMRLTDDQACECVCSIAKQ